MVNLESLYAVAWSTQQQLATVGTLADLVISNTNTLTKGVAADHVLVGVFESIEKAKVLAKHYRALRDAGELPKTHGID